MWLDSPSDSQAELVAHNVRRLMVRLGLTHAELIEAAGIDERTLRAVLSETKRPHARTLHRLASGLGVEPDELFSSADFVSRANFDRLTNSTASDVVAQRPELFDDWTDGDFAELFSRFGVGGPLTADGAAEVAAQMNDNREVLQQARIILETADRELLREFVAMLYRRVTDG
jgi:transcriptional regulator with XRE-family HTH domain